jgi:glucose-6-phosphate 1-dehydrogenase
MEKTRKAVFVLFGGTGDLIKKKISAAFVRLIKDKNIDRRSALIGVSRKDFTDSDYKKFLSGSLDKKEDKSYLKCLNVRYAQGDFSKEDGLDDLKEILSEEGMKNCDRIYYFSTSFKYFPLISEELKKIGLDKNPHGNPKVVFEKPFGEDLVSSRKLNKGIKKVFSEEQIYRIDHYLGKGTIQNLNVLKFANPILDSSLKRKYVDSIEVIVDENSGVGNRLEYYNETGAVKDMIQNHLLQVLSLVLMDKPSEFSSKKICEEKVKVLKSLKVLNHENHVLGQYKSYNKEVKDAKLENNKTETFAKIVLESSMKKWKGVKLILKTGKKLDKKKGQIKINFKSEKVPKNFFEGVKDNKIVFDIYPKQDVNIFMNAKGPYSKELKLVDFEFCEECHFGPNTPDAYSVLLNDILKGDKFMFAMDKEIRESWKIVEKIDKMKDKIKFVKYKDGEDPDKR